MKHRRAWMKRSSVRSEARGDQLVADPRGGRRETHRCKQLSLGGADVVVAAGLDAVRDGADDVAFGQPSRLVVFFRD
jgi:hypothetical protein